MKIAFVFPYNVVGGAFRSTYELSNRLTKRGHLVEIIYPLIDPIQSKFIPGSTLIYRFKSLVRSLYRRDKITWMNTNFKTKNVFFLSKESLTGYDVVILNHWQVIDWATRINLDDQEGINIVCMIRDIEQWAQYSDVQKQYFESKMKFIAVSTWVANEITLINKRATPVIKNALNFNIFNYDYSYKTLLPNESIRLGAILNDHPMKDMGRLAKIFNSIYKLAISPITIEVAGYSKEFFSIIEVPIIHLGLLDTVSIANFYRRQHGFIFTSMQEGWGNPPLEALASGCIVFSTDIGCLKSFDTKRLSNLKILQESQNNNLDAKLILDHFEDVKSLGGFDCKHDLEWLQQIFNWERSCDDLESFLKDVSGY